MGFVLFLTVLEIDEIGMRDSVRWVIFDLGFHCTIKAVLFEARFH